MDKILTDFDSKLFDTLSKSTQNVFFYYADIKKYVSRWSDNAVEYFGLPSNTLNPASLWDEKIHPDDIAEYNRDFENIMKGKTPYHNCEYRIKNANGEYVWVNCRGYMTYDKDGMPEFFAGMVHNLGQISKVDSVTGLWTAYGFRDEITQMLEKQINCAALMIDIRNFKRLNAKYGYDFGDTVLYTIGQTLISVCEKKASAYCIAGTQFVMCLEGGKEDVEALNKDIEKAISDIIVCGQPLHIDISSAATLIPKDGNFFDTINNNLTYTMSTAKQLNLKKVIFFSDEIFKERNRIIRLTETINNCINNNFEGFRIVMQPILNTKTGKIHSAEALLRWSHEDFPNIGPMEFVPILEQTGGIIDVGKWVLDSSFKYIAEWNKTNTTNKLEHVNVNFSYIQFSDETLKDYVVSKLDEYNLPHDTLIAELTESCRVEYTDKLAEILQSFCDEGILIAMDDFGTGYASLMLLKDTPMDIVKIDHSMTRTIKDRKKDRSLVELIIKYCNEMGIDVCTEGVENEEILSIVKSAGTEFVQGYYFDKPLETDVFFEKYIK